MSNYLTSSTLGGPSSLKALNKNVQNTSCGKLLININKIRCFFEKALVHFVVFI